MPPDPRPTDQIAAAPPSAVRAQLEVVRGTQVGVKIHCHRLVSLVGSRPGCKLLLNHPAVSPVHLALVNHGTYVTAVDLVTAHRTELNGLKLEQERLSDGDTITIDPWEFRVTLVQPDLGAAEGIRSFDFEPTPQVVALEHLESGRLLQPNREVCIIGRRKGCDIFIDSQHVSRVHALLITHQGHPAIVDLLSKQHTLVNGEPVTFRVLKNEDVVSIAGVAFRIRTMDSAVGRKPTVAESPTEAPAIIPLPQAPDFVPEDHIDIENVESAQTWRIAECFARVSKQA